MTPIDRFRVRSRPDGAERTAELGVLGPGDAAAVAALQDEAIDDLMFPISGAEIEAMLGPRGRVLGVEAEGRLVAFLAVLRPGPEDGDLALEHGLGVADLGTVANWTAVIVRHGYRGNGLQRRLVEAARDVVLPGVRWWFATARCANLPSARNFLAAGAEIARVVAKYDGMLRYVFVQDRLRPAPAGPAVAAVPCGDVEGQRALLARGLRGFRIDAAAGTIEFREPGAGRGVGADALVPTASPGS